MTDRTSPKFKTADKLAWVYLINLVFYFIPIFITSMTTSALVLSFIALAIFLPLYFRLYRCSSSKARMPLMLMFILSVAITPLNAGSLSFFSYVGFYSGFHYKLKHSIGLWIGQIAIIWILNSYLFPNYYFAIWGSVLTLSIGIIGFANRKQEEAKKLKSQTDTEIKTLATIVERERIARDLHDIMGHSLSSITLKAELASKLIDNQEYALAKKHLNELTEISRDNLTQLRQTVSNYKHKGIATTVTELCQRLRDKGMSVILDGEVPSALSTSQESHLCLILTELANNMMKHSTADKCEFGFKQTYNAHIISITENAMVKTITEGNGLKGIRERIQDIGGQFDYQLMPQLTFEITLPISKDNND